MKSTIVFFSLLAMTSAFAQTDQNVPKNNPKVIETPITIIELDNSKVPASAQPKTIYQCYRGKKVVYVDKLTSGLTNCQQISQHELTKYQPKPPTQTSPTSNTTPHITPNSTLIRPNQPPVTSQSNPYRLPCSGMITYQGQNYLLPSNKPCPIPDTILQQLAPVITN